MESGLEGVAKPIGRRPVKRLWDQYKEREDSRLLRAEAEDTDKRSTHTCTRVCTHTQFKRLGQATNTQQNNALFPTPKLYSIQVLLITDLILFIPFYNLCLLQLSGPGNNFIGA